MDILIISIMHNWNRLRRRHVVINSALVFSMIGGAILAGCAVQEKKSNAVAATSTPQPTAVELLPTAASTEEPTPTEEPVPTEEAIQESEICHQVLTTFEFFQLMNNGADIDPSGAYYVYDANKVSQLGILSGKKIINGYSNSEYPFINEHEVAGTGLQVCYTKMPDGSISKFPGSAYEPNHYRNTANVVTTPRNQFAGLSASNRAFSSKPGRF